MPCCLLGKELKQLKKKIENGFHFEGKVNILGYSIYLESTISWNPPKFSIFAEFSAIKIANGLIALQRSKEESDKGPMLQAKIDASGVVIKIKAFVTILGISVGTVIDVSDNGFEFEVSGSLFDVISAELKVKSKYSDIKTASFSVRNFVQMKSIYFLRTIKLQHARLHVGKKPFGHYHFIYI